MQAALKEITQNYREASLSNVARSYGVSLAYVSECVRAQTGKTYKELLQKHRMETAARLLRPSLEAMKNTTVLEPVVTIRGALQEGQMDQLAALRDAVLAGC